MSISDFHKSEEASNHLKEHLVALENECTWVIVKHITSQDDEVTFGRLVDPAVLDILIEGIVPSNRSDLLILSTLEAIEFCLNFDVFRSEQPEHLLGSQGDIKKYLISQDLEQHIIGLIAHSNPDISEKATKIQIDYLTEFEDE